MAKRMFLIGKRADLSREQFNAHWAGHHADVASRLPGPESHPSGGSVPTALGALFFSNRATAELAVPKVRYRLESTSNTVLYGARAPLTDELRIC